MLIYFNNLYRQPEKIDWYIDDTLIRTQFKKDTCGRQGECRFPSKPA
jgi:hypothetical protein